MVKSRKVIVIGGGIVGHSVALDCLRRGYDTTIIASQPFIETPSWGNAGHIAIEQVTPLASLAILRTLPRRLFMRGGAISLPARDAGRWLPFGLRMTVAALPTAHARGKHALSAALAQAIPAWRRLLGHINMPDLLATNGHLIVWESPATAAAGIAAWKAADVGTATVREATIIELAQIQVHVGQPLAGGVRVAGTGQITDADALAGALAAALANNGGHRIAATARALQRDGDRLIVGLDNDERIAADAVVVAAGAASANLIAPFDERAPLIAERGYHIQSRSTDWPLHLPPVVFEDRATIVTRFRDALRAASFVEFGGVASPADPRKWRRLRAHVAELGLPLKEPIEQWIGARPTLPDYLPAIGRSDRVKNLFYAFGHQHLGLTLGPFTGEAIGALIAGEAPPIDLAPFSLERFRRRSLRNKLRLD